MVYTPKLVSQNRSYSVHDVNSPPSHQSSESGFNSSTQWLRRRFEQSQETSASEDGDQLSPLLLRGNNGNNLALRARSTGFQPFNTLSPVHEQASLPTSPTLPTLSTSSQLQGFTGEQSRTPLQSTQFQLRSRIDTTGSTIRSIQSIAQQDTNRPMSFATPQNATPFYQSQPRAFVPITQSNVAPINTPSTGPVRASDSTFVLGNRFEGQQIPIYSSGS